MAMQLAIPGHFKQHKVGEVYRVDYAQRADDARKWRRDNKLRPAGSDRVKIGLMLIDVQNTFCIPGFELFVAGRSGNGAVDDNCRLVQFIYRELNNISGIDASMDTHRVMQIFHPYWWVNDAGEHPPAYTMISSSDVRNNKWRVNPEVVAMMPTVNAVWLQQAAKDYVEQLEQAGKYLLTIWPYHAMLGGIGHALVSSVEEAMFFHSVTRSAPAGFEIKGGNPITENYSVLSPEVRVLLKNTIAQKNVEFIKRLMNYDYLFIAGQAGSHCLAWTIEDLLTEILAKDPALAQKVYVLRDCTSPVVVPAMDFTDNMNQAFARFENEGMHLVESTTAIADMPGIHL